MKISWLFPQEYRFFDMLSLQAANTLEAAEEFEGMIRESRDWERKRQVIKELEQKGDALARSIFLRLDETFITPIDREDITSLARALDEVIDHIEGVSDRMVLYKIQRVTQVIFDMVGVILAACREVYVIVSELRNFKRSNEIQQHCMKIERLEHDMDALYRMALGGLFDSHDAIEVIKLKDIYERLEEAADKCADVADVVRAVLIKQS